MSRRAVIADDDVLLREGIASLLTGAGWEVVGQTGDGESVERLVEECAPDIAVIDIRMPPGHTTEGLRAAASIRDRAPQIGILLLSAHVEVETAVDLLQGGERIGYLLKSRVMNAADFLDAVDRVARGGSVVDPALVQELVAERHRNDPLADLTTREREVLTLMAEGRSNNGIATRLFITEGAVEKNIRSILAKFRLPATEDDHRRVLAVVRFLENR
jgi:serine/threonine-protein kinase PknK